MNFIHGFVALGLLSTFTNAICPNGCLCRRHWEHGETLSCKGPGIVTFPTDLPKATETIKLEDTNVTELPKDAFSKLPNLKQIHINFNKKLTTLPSGIFNNTDLEELHVVNLNRNDLRSLPDNLFNNLPKLGKVYLKDNALSELPPNTFRNLPNITFINVDGNDLKSLPENLFDETMTKFTAASFARNQLSSLPSDIFRPVKDTLEILYIDSNRFKFLPMNALRIIGKQLAEINVIANPTYCNCSIAEFADWAKGMSDVRVTCDGVHQDLGQIDVKNCELPTTMPSTTAPVTTQPQTTRTEPITTKRPTTATKEPSKPANVPSTTTNVPSTTTDVPSATTVMIPTTTTEPSTPISISRNPAVTTTKTTESAKNIPDPGDIETQDTNDENEQRKKVIIAVSVAAVAAVVLCSLILCLFHTGILSTRRFRKDKVVIYDAEGNVLVSDKEGRS